MLLQDRILPPLNNHLWFSEYGAIISNNAGGYSFVKVEPVTVYPVTYSTEDVGRYIYLRDDDDNDYWSASWRAGW